jgi:hypothetical protein
LHETGSDETGSDETMAMGFGSVVHELALGRGAGFAVWEGETWRGKEAAEFRELSALQGQTPIKRGDYERATTLVTRAWAQLEKMGLEYVLDEGVSEQVAVCKLGGHYMRVMLDKWHEQRGEIWDIKTTGKSAHPEDISRTIPRMHYDLRSEFYLKVVSELTGIPVRKGGLSFNFIFVETEPPFLVTPCYMDAALKMRGERDASRAIEKWARCLETGIWPGYVDGIVEIAAPGYVNFEIEDHDISVDGAKNV